MKRVAAALDGHTAWALGTVPRKAHTQSSPPNPGEASMPFAVIRTNS